MVQPYYQGGDMTQQFNEGRPVAVGEAEAVKSIGMSVHFLRKDRRTKRLIPFFKIGDCVRYDLSRVRVALAAMEEGGLLPRNGSKRRRSA